MSSAVTLTLRTIGVTAALAAVTFSFQTRADVVIGVAVPSSGVKAGAGQEIRAAAEAGVARINQVGGVDGELLRLVVLDDDCSESGGRTSSGTFAGRQAALVLGHPCSRAAMAAAKVYAAAGIWFAAIGAGHPGLTGQRAGPAVFRLTANDGRQAADTAAVLAVRFGGQRVAIIHDRTSYARGLADGVRSGLMRTRVTVALVDGIVAGEKQYGTLAARLKAEQIGVVYFAGFPAERQILIRDMAAIGLTVPVVANDASAGGALEPMARIEAGESFFMARSGDDAARAVTRALDAFVRSGRKLDAFTAHLGVQPDGERQPPSFVPSRMNCHITDCN